MNTVLLGVVERNLADLHGARITGTVPVSEKVLNEIGNHKIAGRSSRLKQLQIQVGTDNYLQVGVQASIGPFTKWFRPEVVVSVEMPVIVFTVASSEYAGLMWIAELFAKDVLPKGVRITGRQVRLDLRDVPELSKYQQMLAYLKTLRISTRKGMLLVDFEFGID